MRNWIAAAVLAVAGMIGTTSAMAVSGGMLAGSEPVAGTGSMIEQVHGCHRGAQDGIGGWHRHVGPNCRRVESSPDWQDPYSRCRTRCRYVGPIKQCRRVCY